MVFRVSLNCIFLRGLFGIIWLKVSCNRSPRHPRTTVQTDPNHPPLHPVVSTHPSTHWVVPSTHTHPTLRSRGKTEPHCFPSQRDSELFDLYPRKDLSIAPLLVSPTKTLSCSEILLPPKYLWDNAGGGGAVCFSKVVILNCLWWRGTKHFSM